jgi:predicted dehydrogenase
LGLSPVARALARAVEAEPIPAVVVGLVHGHVTGFFRELATRPELRLVGVQDPAPALRAGRAAKHNLDASLLFADLDQMLQQTRPRVAFVFTNTQDHLEVVRACARRGVHVMVEKPLAVSVADGRAMASAAQRAKVHLLVNYETTWRPAHAEAAQIARDRARMGELRKIVSMDGHTGPKEIGVEPEFLEWLGDPRRNGGGALYDFGCYGANVMTHLMDGARPLSVTAITQQIKPDVYPRVDDEATILLAYPRAQGIIQASWNWPVGRKDLEIYGQRGFVFTSGTDKLRVRLPDPASGGKAADTARTAAPLPAGHRSPLEHMVAVLRGQTRPSPLASLENNLIVTEILDAARRAAKMGRTVRL